MDGISNIYVMLNFMLQMPEEKKYRRPMIATNMLVTIAMALMKRVKTK